MTLYCDSHHTPTGTLVVTSYAVDQDTPTEAQTVKKKGPASAQVAELVALTEAHKIARGQTANTYTVSTYAA